MIGQLPDCIIRTADDDRREAMTLSDARGCSVDYALNEIQSRQFRNLYVFVSPLWERLDRTTDRPLYIQVVTLAHGTVFALMQPDAATVSQQATLLDCARGFIRLAVDLKT
jgi:hypothetical protein